MSHKKIGQDVSWILWMYYNNKATLFTFCFCNELFFVSLYLCAHDHSTPWFHLFGYAFTWPVILALVNFPIMFGKQVINCVQFWKASKIVSVAGFADASLSGLISRRGRRSATRS